MLLPENERTEKHEGGKHSLSLTNRGRLVLDGVSEAVSFDEEVIVLATKGGTLTVEGEGLHVTKLLLDCGEAIIEGRITALLYSDRVAKKGGFFGRRGTA